MLSTEVYFKYHVDTIMISISLFAMVSAVAIMLKLYIDNFFTRRKVNLKHKEKVFKFNKPNIKAKGDDSHPKAVFPAGIDSEEELVAMEQLMKDLGVDNSYFNDMTQYEGREACLIHWGWIYHKCFINGKKIDT